MTNLFVPPQKMVGYARVAVERAVDRYGSGLTYGIPEHLADLQPGERVIVPLGRGDKPTHGYVLDIAEQPGEGVDIDRIKPIAQRDSKSVRFPETLLPLAQWISSYYCAPLGMTIASMLPAAVKHNIGAVTRTFIDLGEPLDLGAKLPKKQRAILDTLAELPDAQRPIELHHLLELTEAKTAGPINRLRDRGLITFTTRSSIEAKWAEHAVDARTPDRLTPSQQTIVDQLAPALDDGFSAHVIYGVTGSGKTEIYIRLIQQVVNAGRVAVLLVPEISLTPQTGGRLLGRFPDHRVAILHSGLTQAQRHQHWSMIETGEADIVLGARSAVFAPVPKDKLGLIICDEEHDHSYKQDQAPRYHGRDVAIRRAHMNQCPVVLGSATPSLESWHNALTRPGWSLHKMPERIPGMKLPRVQVLDFMDQQRQRRDRHVHLIGPVLQGALGETLDAGGQALLLLNRRGYANYIACPDHNCGWVMTCDHCDVTMVYHRKRDLPKGGYVQCHHCESEQRLPSQCPQCAKKISTFGLGTQRVEEELHRKFPQLVEGETMLRLDSDSMRTGATLHDALQHFGAGDVRVLLGTQMIAKGLDYPNVRLVGVINADTSINLPDFRATERTFQLVSQVSGRCGRGEMPGRVIVQTFQPDIPAIRLAAEHNYEGFAAMELEQRRQCALPPLTRMTRIVVRDRDFEKCVTRAKELTYAVQQRAQANLEKVRVRGPAPCPIARINDKHRQQIEIIAPDAATMQKLLTLARSEGLIYSAADLVIDVDPLALL